MSAGTRPVEVGVLRRDVVSAVVRLCRALRRREVSATTGQALAAARALGSVDIGDPDEVYLALRTVLAGRVEDYEAFDEAFRETWGGGNASRRRRVIDRDREEPPRPRREETSPAGRRSSALSLERWLAGDQEGAEPTGIPLASDQELLAYKDFAAFDDSELEAVQRLAAQLARRIAARPGRRWTAARRGPHVHARRTLRRMLATGGEAVTLAFRQRKPKRVKLVVLCDVSGSMDLYSRLLLQFLYALQNRFARMETFVFATRLSRVTTQLRSGSYRLALREVSRQVRDWSGGTRIGAALSAFIAGWPRLPDRRTVIVILSDGWDTGDPQQLGEAMRVLARRAGRIVWLNPLLGSPGYQPLTRGMQAALPHVDVFAPAHNLASLRSLVDDLRV